MVLASLNLTAWAILLPVVAGTSFWTFVILRISRAMRYQMSVREGMKAARIESPRRLSVVVPAHNEERVIDECVRSLREQDYEDLEIIFVLDRCTDGTAEIVRRHVAEDDRVVMIENDACPDDWAGKCNAARLGAERATGRWILFTDADTEFDPALCRSSVAMALEHDVQLVTLLSTLTCTRFHEIVAQPVASMSLLHLYPPERHARGHPRPFANGQFMLFDREWYERIGGHEGVKEALLEDLAFARRLSEHNGRALVLRADDMLRCSMYDTLPAFVEGWRRIFIDACKRKPSRLRKHGWRLLVVGVFIPLIQVTALVIAVLALLNGLVLPGVLLILTLLLGWLAQAIALGRIYHLARVPKWAVMLYPIGCWIVGKNVFLTAASDLAARRPIRWGGREYVPEPR